MLLFNMYAATDRTYGAIEAGKHSATDEWYHVKQPPCVENMQPSEIVENMEHLSTMRFYSHWYPYIESNKRLKAATYWEHAAIS